MKTAILIPAYKPDMALIDIVKGLYEKSYPIVVVDDGSGDGYNGIFDAIRDMATVLSQYPNQGKGAALKKGIGYINSDMPDCDGIITCDADGQHKLSDIERIKADLEEKGGFVIGARKFDGKVPLRSRFGNSITKLVFLIAAGKKCNDTQTGLRGFSRDLFETMFAIKGNRYEYEMNVLMYTAQNGIAIREVPIATVYENNNEGSHFRVIVDSYRIYKIIFLNSFLIKYGLSAVFCFLLDFGMLALFKSLVFDTETVTLFSFALSTTVLSTLIARMISSPVNYLINRMIVFRSNADKAASFIGYIALAGSVIVVKMALMWLLVDVIHFYYPVANILVEIVLFISNFIIQKLFIFKSKKKPS